MTCEIVVTGASGFVGRALVSQLLRNGFSVTGLSRRRTSGITFVENYTEAPVLDGAILVHLAQSRDTSGGFSDEDIELCRILSTKPWRHIIYASSAVVYGDDRDYPRRPDEAILVSSDYARVKLACEKIISTAGGTCLRLTNLFGPGMGTNTVISDILRQIPGEGPLILRDAMPIRDFLWIEDAASCLISACQILPGEILNVGSGKGMAVGDIAQQALALAGESSRPVASVMSSGRQSCLRLDISKTRAVLNWAPAVDISTGLLSLLGLDKDG